VVTLQCNSASRSLSLLLQIHRHSWLLRSYHYLLWRPKKWCAAQRQEESQIASHPSLSRISLKATKNGRAGWCDLEYVARTAFCVQVSASWARYRHLPHMAGLLKTWFEGTVEIWFWESRRGFVVYFEVGCNKFRGPGDVQGSQIGLARKYGGGMVWRASAFGRSLGWNWLNLKLRKYPSCCEQHGSSSVCLQG